MFKQKKQIPVIHYEGIDTFYQNCPCTLEDKGDCFEISKGKSECKITLNTNQICFIDYLSENEFLQKYHNTTAPLKSDKRFFIINYIAKDSQKKYIAFWSTVMEGRKLNDLKYKYSNVNESYSL